MRDLILFVQIIIIYNYSNLVTIPHACFSRFLHCSKGTKSQKASYLIETSHSYYIPFKIIYCSYTFLHSTWSCLISNCINNYLTISELNFIFCAKRFKYLHVGASFVLVGSLSKNDGVEPPQTHLRDQEILMPKGLVLS